MTLPDCPLCDARATLEPLPFREGPEGKYHYCTCCSAKVLVKDGEVKKAIRPK